VIIHANPEFNLDGLMTGLVFGRCEGVDNANTWTMRTRGQCEHVDGRGHVQDWRGDAGRREQDRRGVPGEGGGEWTG